ncbi:succinate--CoA ligase subunit beta [Marinibacterium profundimaris]|uniref:Succinyl-CoA synthetase subunit beta n=1 Tax=Marinibacterium profundimaris TaxID=1679460 RepID=A0A225NMI6_9RHOB|nr:ATP-grasp domain-containing protein [Marinibacterium profundimaris]OWU75602.1 succinyl-CoA synthetase subunit beta [Marinibacterium profundimaris]
MFVSEHQSKELLAQYDLPVPVSRLARTPEEAERRCAEIGARKYVVKAQITAGGRGLAGGVKFAATPSAVADEARRLLGNPLVTAQTGAKGEMVTAVSVEEALDLAESYYFAFVLDTRSGAPMLLASSEGGVEFEQRSQMDPSTVKSFLLESDTPETRDALAGFLSEIGIEQDPPTGILMAALRAFIDNDMTLLEINPFARTSQGEWSVIDAKIALDGAALFRHPEFESLAGKQGLSEVEMEAQANDINLVRMDGNIGVVVNGAGLGLATNDMVFDAGGQPANFMDIRTTATSFDIAKGVSLLLEEPRARVILLNVHGGGMTACDTVAEGISFAYSRSDRKLPVVARLAGQNADWGIRILKDRKIPVEVFDTMSDAVSRAVELAS